MFWQALSKIVRPLRRYGEEKRGSVAVYAGLVTALTIGGGVLAIDVGQMEAIRNEMQNYADAAALSAATQLTGVAGSRYQAEAVAREAIDDGSVLTQNRTEFLVRPGVTITGGVRFWSQLINKDVDNILDDMTDPTQDAQALYVEVILEAEPVTLIMQPILSMMSNFGKTKTTANINARATATNAGFVCEPAQLMVCDPREAPEKWGANPHDIMDPLNAGREMIGKDASGQSSSAAGQFGLLCPPDSKNCGAKATGDWIAGNSSGTCTNTDVQTNPGNQVMQISWAFDSRFDISPTNNNSESWYPSGNVVSYGHDTDILEVYAGTEMLSNGSHMTDGDVVSYWPRMHPNWGTLKGNSCAADMLKCDPDILDGVNGVPDRLETLGLEGFGATRYQIFLYEMGVPFLAAGQITVFPVDNLTTGSGNAIAPNTTVLPDPPAGETWKYVVNPNGKMLPCGNMDTNVTLNGRSDNPNGSSTSFTGAYCVDAAPVGPGNDNVYVPDHANSGRPVNPNKDFSSSEVKSTTPDVDAVKRRLLLFAVLECEAQDVKGSGTFNSHGRYVQGFMVNPVAKNGAGLTSSYIIELIGPVVIGEGGFGGAIAANAGVHSNVRLVE